MNIKGILEKSWLLKMKQYTHSESFISCMNFVEKEYQQKIIFPEYKNLYRAFTLTPFSNVKVVILGQDPYHNEGQADGLSFSVQNGVSLPPSLKNIYKEIESDIGILKDFSNGNLESWATQGVLLLNSILTVAAHSPASHRTSGWEDFTDEVIKTISSEGENIVFILWGEYAKKKKRFINTKRHLVLEAPHPSPFSANAGFFGCKHFSKCNLYLRKHNKKEILW